MAYKATHICYIFDFFQDSLLSFVALRYRKKKAFSRPMYVSDSIYFHILKKSITNNTIIL